MADIAHVIGCDLTISSTGDLSLVDTSLWTQQRVLRRLITNAGDYIWQLSYGGGLAAMVGATISAQQAAAIIRKQMSLEAAISSLPEPRVVIQSDQGTTVFATVSYQDAQTGTSQTLNVPGFS